ncbi:hypothetical protein [uncultured Desulfobacter sp.]|uniref:hypothetical protein n=1 Tax=uncultured Desulfobacter sp. TaxID=240139 RepID=UPI002AAA865A|nr:hypothetical protein [uncultured Desulfobacter sp.]
MLPIQTKLASIKTDITTIRDIFSGEQEVLDALDVVESGLDALGDVSVSMTTSQLGKAQDLQSAACLALQLPIDGPDAAFDAMIGLVAGLAEGIFMEAFGSVIADLTSGPSAVTALSILSDVLADVQNKQAQINNILSLFDQFDTVHGLVKVAIGVVSTLMGCNNSAGQALSNQWGQVSGILSDYNSDFLSGVAAVEAAAENYSNPIDVINDAKGRVTANMDLDSRMDALTAGMADAAGWLV